ncbi:MAG: sugar ABC transporter ATP-binding protein [Anaerolineae bacterium]|nr:sugar ABC transporter ATP-binding protein [Anaerolineae bacterium]
MNAPPILELKDISKQFRTIQALNHVDFDLREGEVHALVGENGAGKSTLVKILAGVYAEYEGTYCLDDQPVHFQSPRDAQQHGIGMIHQELSVIPPLSVAENLFLGRQPLTQYGTIDWQQMTQTAQEELHKLGFDLDVKLPLEHYSLGTQQVVEVLRAIISGARVLIMDEPTSALSPAEVDGLLALVNTLREQGRSIIYISHFLEEVVQVADRITVLRNGDKVDTVQCKDTSLDRLIAMILGREMSQTTEPLNTTRSFEQTLLQVRDLTADVFSHINLEVGKGEIVGIYGAIGAGHFDLARALFGLYQFDSGEIIVDGEAFPSNFSTRYAIRHGLAYATESRRKSLLMDEPIYRNITMPHLERIGRYIPMREQELAAAAPTIPRVNVQPPDPLNPVGKLSGGNQQKVAIARWLTFPPKVFIASEPTRGMDVGAKSEVLTILRNLRDEGYGVLVITSEPETILAVADRVIVMSRGRIVSEMINTENLDKDSLMRLI